MFHLYLLLFVDAGSDDTVTGQLRAMLACDDDDDGPHPLISTERAQTVSLL